MVILHRYAMRSSNFDYTNDNGLKIEPSQLCHAVYKALFQKEFTWKTALIFYELVCSLIIYFHDNLFREFHMNVHLFMFSSIYSSEHIAPALCATLALDNKYVISGSDDSSIIVALLETGKLVRYEGKIVLITFLSKNACIQYFDHSGGVILGNQI